MQALAIALVNLLVGALLGYLGGAHQQRLQASAQQARQEATAQADLAAAQARFRQVEAGLQQRFNNQATTYQQELARVKAAHQDFADRLRGRTLSVSIPVASCSPASSAAPADPAAEPAPAHAQLAPETALALDAIATDGDAAAIDLNRCLAAYQDARTAVAAATCSAH